MKNIKEPVVDYFQAPEGYFWQWTDRGEVIEWIDGKTICYREDLTVLLKSLLPIGIPPLGPLLLVLAACQDTWYEVSESRNIFIKILSDLEIENESKKQELQKKLDNALQMLSVIHQLPLEYRTGQQRVLLLEAVFSDNKGGIAENEFGELLFYFEKGAFDTILFSEKRLFNTYIFQNHIEYLASALVLYPDVQTLERKIRTGIFQLPAAPPMEIPAQKSSTEDFMESLAEDSRTEGLTRLAKKMIASLNVPLHAILYNDNLMGGVSDISNKGTFDRLLLSELANDDALLTARLANNEALYLQREQQPDKQEQQRIILVDTTIKMWGLPRVFALATSLAFTHLYQKNISTKVYALTGNDFQEFDFSSKEEIVRAMETMDAHLHCGKALKKIFSIEKQNPNTEYYFISDELNYAYLDFQLCFSEIRNSLDYLIKINRDGDFQLFSLSGLGQKLLYASTFNLNELLWTSASKTVVKKKDLANWPEFMQLHPAPLLFPSSKVKPKTTSRLYVSTYGIVTVTIDQRLLHWEEGGRGAIERLPFIETGNYFFGCSDRYLLVLVKDFSKKQAKFYRIDKTTHEVVVESYEETIPASKEVVYLDNAFFIYNEEDNITIEIDAHASAIVTKQHADKAIYKQKFQLTSQRNYALHDVKKFMNNGYSVVNKVRSIFITQNKEIVLDHHEINLYNQTTLMISENTKPGTTVFKKASCVEIDYAIEDYPNTQVKFSRFLWKDGSEAIVDSRGLLHLKSSDKHIPEITIVLVMNQPSACWASDGTFCGSEYFTERDTYQNMKVAEFYDQYIHRFISTIS